MKGAFWNLDYLSGSRDAFSTFDIECCLAFQNMKEFLLSGMPMQRWVQGAIRRTWNRLATSTIFAGRLINWSWGEPIDD